MATEGPFGQVTRLRVLHAYFAQAGEVTTENAWEHVYRCLLWINLGTGLAHIYDSNHMQPGGNFHDRAVRFTELLCDHWKIQRQELSGLIDYLFKGCVAEWRRNRVVEFDVALENDLITAITQILRDESIKGDRSVQVARRIEALSRDFFTIGNKRKNALGEGFEDLLFLLLRRVSHIPAEKIALRSPVSNLPGFRRPPVRRKGARADRQPHPDLAIIEPGITHVITTAKWSMRQDRETQFQSEYNAYQRNKTQQTELQFALVTNEFDTARLDNVSRAFPTGEGGYIFHKIYHINPKLLQLTHGDKIGSVANWIGLGKIVSLEDFLTDMRERFGTD